MKKTLFVLISVLLFLSIFSFNSFARSTAENELIEKSNINEIIESLDKETKSFLEELGVDKTDYSKLFNLNYKSFVNALVNSFKDSLSDIKNHFLGIMSAVLLCALLSSFSNRFNETNKKIYDICICAFIASVSLIPIMDLINSSEGIIISSCNLSGAVIPILCTISAAQGRTVSAGVFNSAAVVFSQLLSEAYILFFVPCADILLAFSISSCFDSKSISKGLVKLIKKYFLIFLSICSSVYFTILGIKGSLSSAADESAVKALKLAAGNFVPVIGSAISESASVVLSSLSITKSAIGVFGVISVFALYLPIIFKIILWILSFDLCSAVAEAFSEEKLNELLKTVSSILSIFAIMVVFCALMMIINIGILTSLRG